MVARPTAHVVVGRRTGVVAVAEVVARRTSGVPVGRGGRRLSEVVLPAHAAALGTVVVALAMVVAVVGTAGMAPGGARRAVGAARRLGTGAGVMRRLETGVGRAAALGLGDPVVAAAVRLAVVLGPVVGRWPVAGVLVPGVVLTAEAVLLAPAAGVLVLPADVRGATRVRRLLVRGGMTRLFLTGLPELSLTGR